MTSTGFVEPPRQLDDPRPPVETLRKWPFVVVGCAAVAVLGAVTIGPSLLRGEPEPRRIEPEPRSHPFRTRSYAWLRTFNGSVSIRSTSSGCG